MGASCAERMSYRATLGPIALERFARPHLWSDPKRLRFVPPRPIHEGVHMKLVQVCTLAAFLAVSGHPIPSHASISGTASVEPGSGEFAEYWCYTIEFTWDSPHSLSNLSTFVGFEGLECACDPGIFAFPTPAGTTTGYEDGVECTLEYIGEYLCTGNPSLPGELSDLAAVKFDPSPETCDAGTTGSGSVTFYSLLAPGNTTYHQEVIVVKAGTGTVVGDISGLLPAADCSVDGHHSDWGSLKRDFENE